MQATDSLEALNVSFLRHEERFLLLQRSQNKSFAPGRWTGLGGHVEMDEYDRLRFSALREVREESGVPPEDIANFVLRRTLLVSRPRQPIRVVLYFTGLLAPARDARLPRGDIVLESGVRVPQPGYHRDHPPHSGPADR